MTSSTAKAPVELLPGSPTTKSLCPAGAGLIDQGEATKGAHTPPQACAAPAIDRATATTPATPHAQLAKGYKHPLPATTGHTTAEEDAMTTTKETKAAKATIKDLQNLIRTQHEYTEGLAGLLRQIRTEGLTDSLALQADQILQKHTPCSTCGGQAPDCPDCDGARTRKPATAVEPTEQSQQVLVPVALIEELHTKNAYAESCDGVTEETFGDYCQAVDRCTQIINTMYGLVKGEPSSESAGGAK